MLNKTAAHAVPAATTALRVIIAILIPQLVFGLSFAWIGLAPYVRQQSQWPPIVIGAIFALTPLFSALTLLFSGRLVTLFPLR